MPLRYVKWITREMVRANPDQIFLFGDNVERVGRGGQAKAMRDEPNTIGIATKWKPDLDERSFFVDWNPACRTIMMLDLIKVEKALEENRVVNVPTDGLGTGLSQLPQRAPKLYDELVQFFRYFSDKDHPCPW